MGEDKVKLFELSGVNREEFIESVRKDCQSFLQNSSPAHLLYRGMKGVSFYDYNIPRNDRKPRDTSPKAHKKLDELFEEKFGFKYRSGGVFATPIPGITNMYSDSRYVIFPAGEDFMMCGSISITDIVQAIEMSGIIGSSQLKFSPYYARAKLASLKEYNEYERLAGEIGNRTPDQEKRYDELTYEIFSNLDYFESKRVIDFRNSEVQIKCKGYYSAFYDERSKDTEMMIEKIYE